jgi:hypothetical protein
LLRKKKKKRTPLVFSERRDDEPGHFPLERHRRSRPRVDEQEESWTGPLVLLEKKK